MCRNFQCKYVISDVLKPVQSSSVRCLQSLFFLADNVLVQKRLVGYIKLRCQRNITACHQWTPSNLKFLNSCFPSKNERRCFRFIPRDANVSEQKAHHVHQNKDQHNLKKAISYYLCDHKLLRVLYGQVLPDSQIHFYLIITPLLLHNID